MIFMGSIFKIITVLVLLSIVSADYQLTILLDSLSIDGKLPSGDSCSVYSGLGVKCFPRPKICIEPLEYANGNLDQCVIGSYIDVGVWNNTNDLTFNSMAYYGGWYNPSTFEFFGDYKGFSVKMIIWNADGTNYQEITRVQWNITAGSSSPADESNDRITSFKFQWTTAVQTVPTGAPTTPTTPGSGGASTSTGGTPSSAPADCSTITAAGSTPISIGGASVNVYCDGKGGTAIQRRTDNTSTFYSMEISDYKTFFGAADKSYWLGLDNINTFTSGSTQYTAVITTCCKTTPYIETYDTFAVGDAVSKYTLSVAGATGNRLMATGLNTQKTDNNSPFSTYNDFNLDGVDAGVCASALKAGGWWFGSCDNNLNGHFYGDAGDYSDADTCAIDVATQLNANGAGISYPVGISYQKTQIVLYQKNAFRNFDINAAAQEFCT